MKTKEQRNKKIYNHYMGSGLSFNKLSKVYNLTPQRIQKIVSDYKKTKIATPLQPNASQKEREEYKNLAVETRENSQLQLALNMFNNIIIWDNKNKNYRGIADVLGQIAITNNKLAESTKNNAEKKEYIKQSYLALEKATKLQDKKLAPVGGKAITYVQIAATKNRAAQLLKGKSKNSLLLESLNDINFAIKNLPGSKAHKAWPLKVKAQILARLKKYDEAINTLATAEKQLYLGYQEEMGWAKNGREQKKGVIGNDQAIIKLQVWLVGIQLTYAQIFKKTGRDLLAKFYAQAVLNMEDKEGVLKESKKTAKQILNEVN